MTDFANLFEALFKRLDSRHKPELIETLNRKTGEKITGTFLPDGSFKPLYSSEADARFPAVTVFDQSSLIHYLARYGAKAIADYKAVLYVNQAGLTGVIDYGYEGQADYRRHQVKFPAAWDEACRPSAEALTRAIGSWTSLENFTMLLDKCAPFIGNFAALESATSTIEGHETAKIVKTARSFQVAVTGEVSSTAEIPKIVAVQLLFMGRMIKSELPLRVTVKDKQVQFYIVDDGSITKAKAQILSDIKADVAAQFENLLVMEGSIA